MSKNNQIVNKLCKENQVIRNLIKRKYSEDLLSLWNYIFHDVNSKE